jgi:hypothetical protein
MSIWESVIKWTKEKKYLANMFYVELKVVKLQLEQQFFPCIVSYIAVFPSQ